MTTTTAARRITVAADIARTAGNQYHRLRIVLSNYNRITGNVMAVHCPACDNWVKPRRYSVPAGTCRRCARNRDIAAYHAGRDHIRNR